MKNTKKVILRKIVADTIFLILLLAPLVMLCIFISMLNIPGIVKVIMCVGYILLIPAITLLQDDISCTVNELMFEVDFQPHFEHFDDND